MSSTRAVAVAFALILGSLLACELTTTDDITVIDPQTGEVHVVGSQGRGVATSPVCAEGDYVPTPSDAAVRAAECYNRGQEDAFGLKFEYSGGDVYTNYVLRKSEEAAITASKGSIVEGYYAFIEDGKAGIAHYQALSWSSGGGGEIRVWTPPEQTRADAVPTIVPKMCIYEYQTPFIDDRGKEGIEIVQVEEPCP